MHVVIRKFKLSTGAADEIIDKVRRTFLPSIQRSAGFRDYYFLRLGDDQVCTVSCFDTRRQAEDSVKLALDWIKENAVELMPNAPEVLSGDVAFDAHGFAITTGTKAGAQPSVPVH